MEPEDIDWNSIESIFEQDDTYENINAPKWVDLCLPLEPADEEAWFCNPDCNHPNCADDYLKVKQNSKMKILRSVFRDRTHSSTLRSRETKTKTGLKGSKSAQNNSSDDSENKNPNLTRGSSPTLTPSLSSRIMSKKSKAAETDKKVQLEDSGENAAKHDRKLKSTFSARNLVGGREILNQITEFCAELKKMAKKGSKKGASEKAPGSVGVSGDSGRKEMRGRERERMPLLKVREGKQ